MTYDAAALESLEKADEKARSAHGALTEASVFFRRLHPRHPLYYRANVILREIEDLRALIRREQSK